MQAKHENGAYECCTVGTIDLQVSPHLFHMNKQTLSNLFCYDILNNSVLYQILSSRTMKINFQHLTSLKKKKKIFNYYYKLPVKLLINNNP